MTPEAAVHRTSFRRAALGIVAGAAVGGVFVVVPYLIGVGQVLGLGHLREYGLQKGLTVFAIATVVWAIGMALLGVPAWLALHHAGRRSWRVAAATGAVLAGAAMLILSTGAFGLMMAGPDSSFSAADAGGPTWVYDRLTAHGWMNALRDTLKYAAAGAMIGLVVWRTAYRREDAG